MKTKNPSQFPSSTTGSSRPCPNYQVRVRGHLDQYWANAFDGFEMECLENGETLLTSLAADQSTLIGLLNQLHAFNLTLLSFTSRAENFPPESIQRR